VLNIAQKNSPNWQGEKIPGNNNFSDRRAGTAG